MATKKKEAEIIDGKNISEKILLEARKEIIKTKRHPGLAVILVGKNPASELYVKNKKKACEKVGVNFHEYRCAGECFRDITEKEIIQMIEFLNNDPAINGILVQLPLPKKFNTENIIRAIHPSKDVDGFHPKNRKLFLEEKDVVKSPVVRAVEEIIDEKYIQTDKKRALIISNSEILGNALKMLLKKYHCDTRIVSEKNSLLKKEMKSADIIISALDRPEFITGNMIKKGSVLIDIGITKTPKGYRGNVDCNSVKKIASAYTPTPGGVGPLTVAMLIKNTIELSRKNQYSI